MTTTPIRRPALDAVAGWLGPHNASRLLEPLDKAAALVAEALERDDDVTFTLAVGNGWQYRTAISLLPPEAEGDWGGNLLVSLPEFHRCLLLNDTGGAFHVPGYLEEKLGLGEEHSKMLAGFLTLLSDHRTT